MKPTKYWSGKQNKVRLICISDGSHDRRRWSEWKDSLNSVKDYLKYRGSYILNSRLNYNPGEFIIIFYPGYARLEDIKTELKEAFPTFTFIFSEKENKTYDRKANGRIESKESGQNCE